MTTSPLADIDLRADSGESVVSIYALLDEQRQIRYVGQSVHPAGRVRSHWRRRYDEDRVRRNPRLTAWLQGMNEPPAWELLQVVTREARHAAEAYWTDLLRQVPGMDLLNIFSGATPGAATRARLSTLNAGNTPWMKGKTHTEAARAKISAAQKGRTVSLETRARMIAAQRARTSWPTGHTHTPEARERIGAAHRGKTVSEETRSKISTANKGRRLSDETRARISEASKGRVLPEKWCEECQRSWSMRVWTRHVRKYHEGGKW